MIPDPPARMHPLPAPPRRQAMILDFPDGHREYSPEVEVAGTDILSPDCRDGKCAACVGDAWDDNTDQPCACQCVCHETKEGE